MFSITETMKELELEELLEKRFKIVELVWRYKKQHKLPSLDANRWKEVRNRNVVYATSLWMNQEFISNFWNRVHALALQSEDGVTIFEQGKEYNLSDLRKEIDILDTGIIDCLSQFIFPQDEVTVYEILKNSVKSF